MHAKTTVAVRHFEISDDTRHQIHATVATLIDTGERINRVEVVIEGDYGKNTCVLYDVTLRIHRDAETLSELKQGDKLVPAVQSAVFAMRRRLLAPPQPQSFSSATH